MYARSRHTRSTHKARQTQALHLVGLTVHKIQGLSLVNLDIAIQACQNPGQTRPPQGSINQRFTLSEPFLLLSFISIGTQGTQGSPLMIFFIPNFYLCRNTSLHEQQKPKVCPWYALLENPRHPLGLLTHSNYDDHRQRSKFNKMNYDQTIWQDLQSGRSHTYSS